MLNDITNLKTRQNNLENSILSVSGWRKIFATDQKENSYCAQINKIDQEFIIVAGCVLAAFFNSQKGFIVIAHDSRPTSRVITKILMQSLIACHFNIKFFGLTSAPQAMAYTKKIKYSAGFIYITASHNPPGYNGLKIGNQNGEVIAAKSAEQLINKFKKAYLNNKQVQAAIKNYNQVKTGLIQKVCQQQKKNYQHSSKIYQKFILETATRTTNINLQNQIINNLRKQIIKNKVYLAYDYNGSARIRSVDQEILKKLGVKTLALNAKLGRFSHQIAPENKGLIDLEKFLIQERKFNIIFGITFDCDGDRGNFVLYKNSKRNKILRPDAQFSYLLAVLSELAFAEVFLPHRLKKTVVVANDPTSLRINEICQKFSVKFKQAEVGEANVVNLGKELRKKGYNVPLVGEGSNGGTIIYPSTVRDPLSTIFSLLKLLYLKNPAKNTSSLECVLNKYGENLHPSFKSQDYLHLLWKLNQDFITTSVFDPMAIIKIQTKNQKKLKQKYESIFRAEYLKKQKYLQQKYQIESYQILNYESTKTRIGAGNRTGQENGGFKIMLYSADKKPFGWLWMRGSKTEPVFRVMVDVRGSKKDHGYFLQWHRSILKRADQN